MKKLECLMIAVLVALGAVGYDRVNITQEDTGEAAEQKPKTPEAPAVPAVPVPQREPVYTPPSFSPVRRPPRSNRKAKTRKSSGSRRPRVKRSRGGSRGAGSGVSGCGSPGCSGSCSKCRGRRGNGGLGDDSGGSGGKQATPGRGSGDGVGDDVGDAAPPDGGSPVPDDKKSGDPRAPKAAGNGAEASAPRSEREKRMWDMMVSELRKLDVTGSAEFAPLGDPQTSLTSGAGGRHHATGRCVLLDPDNGRSAYVFSCDFGGNDHEVYINEVRFSPRAGD